MKRWAIKAIVWLLPVLVARPTSPCDDDLVRTWNQFARDANAYISTVDVKNRAKRRNQVEREWIAVTRCECW